MQLTVTVSEAVLERLIASGALCAEEILCAGAADKRCLSAICKRSCAQALARRDYSISSLRPS